MRELIRKLPRGEDHVDRLEPMLNREWLITNGMGGYAAGTVAGVVTRRYHGLLIAALPAPAGRMLLLPHLSEQVRLSSGENVRFGGEERTGRPIAVPGADFLSEFRLETGLPVWRYEVDDIVIEKRVLLPHFQNTVYVVYLLLSGPERVRLKLLPSVSFRSHDAQVSTPLPPDCQLLSKDGRHEISAGSQLPTLRMTLKGECPAFTSEPKHLTQMLYRIEESRGYDSKGDLWSPGYFRVDLIRGQSAAFVASTEPWKTIDALTPDDVMLAETERRLRLLGTAQLVADIKGDSPQLPPRPEGCFAQMGTVPFSADPFAEELVLAADQFIIRPAGRAQEAARIQAAGDEARTVIAGYHWFTDWGRDTMISLEGLALVTGRHSEAGYILRTFAQYIRNGLIPNLFPEGKTEGLYHTADASLWFFHAIARYLEYSNDALSLKMLLPRLRDIIDWHMRGTSFGIGVDPADGLLRQGAEGYQLTWMDAKVGDWVVTPRRGKAVEINALWYNALRLVEHWVAVEQVSNLPTESSMETCSTAGADAASPYRAAAEQAKKSFNERFWNADRKYLYDVVDGPSGNDPSCRPNQILSFSLDYPVLNEEFWQPVLDVVEQRLLTPVGLRTLAPGEPDYHSRYDGDLRSRDAAYHQGTVWAWLIGPYVDAWLRLHPQDRAGARRLLCGFDRHMSEACIGSISEVFDGEQPHAPRGCVAQAWSVAEVLRAYVKTA